MSDISHRSFCPTAIPNRTIIRNRKIVSSRNQLSAFMLIVSLFISVASVIVVVYLGIENYRRNGENRILSSKLEKLEVDQNQLLRLVLSLEQQPTSVQEPIQMQLNTNISNLHFSSNERSQSNTRSKGSSENTNLSQVNFVKEDSRIEARKLKTTTGLHRYYAEKFKSIDDTVQSLEKAQSFFRQQVHQQLIKLSQHSFAFMRHLESIFFMASLAKDHVPTIRGDIIVFSGIHSNEGGAYDRGQFSSLHAGTFVFFVDLVFRPKKLHANFESYQPLDVALRRNGLAIAQIFKQNKPFYVLAESAFDLTISKNIFVDLEQGDTIDIFTCGSPNWVIIGNKFSIISSFSGNLIFNER